MQIFFHSLEPEWAAAATEVKEQTKGKVKLAAVDATVNQVLAGRYGVSVQMANVFEEYTLFSAVTSSGIRASLCGRRGDVWPFCNETKLLYC